MACAAPAVLGFLFWQLGPIVASLFIALTDWRIAASPNWIGLDNFQHIVTGDRLFRKSLAVTAYYALGSVPLRLVAAFALAVLLNQKIRGKKFFRTLFFMPVILGVAIQGLIWKLFLLPRGGPASEFFQLFGWTSELLGGQPRQAFAWVIAVQIWANAGITMVIFLAGMQTIPEELYEAARIDGAGKWQLFRNVTWPLLTPAVNTNLLLNIIGSLQAWQLFLVLIGYRPGTQVLGYLVFAEGFGQTSGSVASAFRQGYAAAASIALFVLVLVFALVTHAWLSRREKRYIG
jgi:raffinose/stachyose/melibiose transport system permease protein